MFIRTFFIFFLIQTFAGCVGTGNAEQSIPSGWLKGWKKPSPEMRPLQIVHGINLGLLKTYKSLGLGGIVCNVDFKDYMRSEEKWKILVTGVKECSKLGMIVWIYDEDGYPSGAAGGLVLEENPDFEAKVLAFDAGADPPFTIRSAYEHTHASNNFYAARRYPNLIDDRATGCFIEKTYDAYWRRLKPFFGTTIKAFFTDEPSLIAINLGQLPEKVRKRVRVVDSLDENVKALPTVPWSYDIVRKYKEKYGEDLVSQRLSLFKGQTKKDHRIRRQFWNLISVLISERYFNAINMWCRKHKVASSGHSLWEERILHHVPFEGNGLKVLGCMTIPGLDLLNSNPEAVIYSGWLTAGLPASAALLTGKRRVMTEVSDFSQKLGDKGPVSLLEMQSVAAWQASWGVTDFNLYYGIHDRSENAHHAYCEYVGRLNSVLKQARRTPAVLLYYPIYDLWSEYLPKADPVKMESQTQRAQKIVSSFMRLGQSLQQRQIPFCLVDHENLKLAKPLPGGVLKIGDYSFRALVLPEGARLPDRAEQVKKKFMLLGGKVLPDGAGKEKLSKKILMEKINPPYRFEPSSDRISFGTFFRDGRRILLVANVAKTTYSGNLVTGSKAKWLALDPAKGMIRRIDPDRENKIHLELKAREAVLLVEASHLKRQS